MIDEPTDVPIDAQPEAPDEEEPGKARALTLHVLRMFETRMDAAGIALQSEIQAFSSKLQLRLLGAAALFLALWAGIVLAAIAVPERLRIPVLAGIVAAFVIGGIWAFLAAKRAATVSGVGSLSWFLDNLKLDVDVLARSLAQRRQQRQGPEPAPSPEHTPEPPPAANEPSGSKPDDLAA